MDDDIVIEARAICEALTGETVGPSLQELVGRIRRTTALVTLAVGMSGDAEEVAAVCAASFAAADAVVSLDLNNQEDTLPAIERWVLAMRDHANLVHLRTLAKGEVK